MIPEIERLRKWLGDFPRHPNQIHGLNESDAEIIQRSDGSYLATTIDTISEEIALGLYRDPYTIGWITAMAGLSDLAATGAKPIGVLLSSIWSDKQDVEFRKKTMEGFKDALKNSGTFLLGGDTGQNILPVLTITSLGEMTSTPLTRLGIREGDFACITGVTGPIPSIGYGFLMGDSRDDSQLRPIARFDAAENLGQYASACMDTSDGVLATLATLCDLNGVGLDWKWNSEFLDPISMKFILSHELPIFLLPLAELGDYQLVFSLPEENLNPLQRKWNDFHILGRFSAQLGIRLEHDCNTIDVDVSLSQRLDQIEPSALKRVFETVVREVREGGYP